MEEILASIRRIIADDQSLPGRAGPRVPTLEHDAVVEAEPGTHALDDRELDKNRGMTVPDREGLTRESAEEGTAPFAHEGASSAAGDRAIVSEEPAMSHPEHAADPTYSAPEPAGYPDDAGASEVDPYFDASVEPDDALAPSLAPGPQGLFSTHTGQSVSSAFNMLAATRLADNSEELLDLAREMIRPLLKTWLDDNLPSMVERMVRAEIERVARGTR